MIKSCIDVVGECATTQNLQLLRARQVYLRLAISRSSFYAMVKEGLLPCSIAISERSMVWALHEIDAVIAAIISGANKENLRKLSAQIEENRKISRLAA